MTLPTLTPSAIKPISFIVVFSLCLFFEHTKACFEHNYKRRFAINFLLLFLSIGTIQLLMPIPLYELLHSSSLFELPPFIGLALTLLSFDFLIYWQHRLFHKIPFLWRIHRVHHCDTSMDLSTGLRFHPLEILISFLYKLFFIFLFDIPYIYFLIYETLLFSMSLFNHSNLAISPMADRILRKIIVTPSMHYPHHHPDKAHTNSNYGNFLSLWDRLFRSYNSSSTRDFGVNGITEDQAKSLRFLMIDSIYERSQPT